MNRLRTAGALATLLTLGSLRFFAAAPLEYRLTFPEPQHRWMQVEATFPDLPEGRLELRMSRSSPGRYSLHEFAKNVYDVHVFDRAGTEMAVERPDPEGWSVAAPGTSVTVKYKVFGDLVDGTYLAIDPSHAHINMPAAIMWARGLDDRPSSLTFVAPQGADWQVATQLHPGSTPLEFTAPNLQYLMDSPVEFARLSIRQFSVGSRRFRFALHHAGTDADLDSYLKDVEKIVRQEGMVFGEFPQYEPGYYTFLADYLPYAGNDGMEHRNSTVMTSPGSIRASRPALLGTVAHEFFHGWNVERIRPRSLEPFDFDRANISAELWLAEGFTQYYGPLVLQRAGLADLSATVETFEELVDAVELSPGRAIRSAEDMSRMAPFTDGGKPANRVNWPNTYTSYYPFGGAIALALDLTLRERSDNRITLDDYMQAMWRVHGRPGGTREGYVNRPYTLADAEARLAEVSGNPDFARDFFKRYIDGREAADYPRLLSQAGLVVRKQAAGRAWWGDVRLDMRNGALRILAPVPSNSPLYAAGLDEDDEVLQLDGAAVHSYADLRTILDRHKPGDRLRITYRDRTALDKTATVVLAEDPHLDIVPLEAAGMTLTSTQRTFRARWLAAK